MSRALRDRRCQVVAIEIDASAAEQASAFCERVIVGDIEQIDLAQELGADRFDVIVSADFLERLKDPLTVLRALKGYLRPDGRLVASLPNVAHGSVRLALLAGQFPYGELGLLDRTHLRFYTRASIEQLFEDAGLAIGRLDRQDLPIDASEVQYDRAGVPAGVLEALARDPEALTYQFVVVAYPLPSMELRRIRRRLREQEDQIEAARREAADLHRTVAEQAEHIEMLEARLESVCGREAELRTLLLDAHDQLLRRDDELDAAYKQEMQRSDDALAAAHEEIRRREEALESLRPALEVAHREIARREEALESLRPALESAHQEIERREQALVSLRPALDGAHREIARLEEALDSLRSHLEAEQVTGRRHHAEIASLVDELARAREEIHQMQATKVWRLASRYWLARDRAKSALRPG